jgi:hypothetical protein
MVASGLPVRNKDKHVLEIALLSLDVITIVSEAKIPHLPDERWAIRIGLIMYLKYIVMVDSTASYNNTQASL